MGFLNFLSTILIRFLILWMEASHKYTVGFIVLSFYVGYATISSSTSDIRYFFCFNFFSIAELALYVSCSKPATILEGCVFSSNFVVLPPKSN